MTASGLSLLTIPTYFVVVRIRKGINILLFFEQLFTAGLGALYGLECTER